MYYSLARAQLSLLQNHWARTVHSRMLRAALLLRYARWRCESAAGKESSGAIRLSCILPMDPRVEEMLIICSHIVAQ